MTVPRRRSRLPGQPRQLDAGPLEPLIGSFALHLTAEGKAARTVQGYTSAVRWFAVGYLAGRPGKTSWQQADQHDVQRWMSQLLRRYSGAYASIQFRALRQFFRWLAGEEELPDPMARLRAPKVTVTAVPVFTSVESVGTSTGSSKTPLDGRTAHPEHVPVDDPLRQAVHHGTNPLPDIRARPCPRRVLPGLVLRHLTCSAWSRQNGRGRPPQPRSGYLMGARLAHDLQRRLGEPEQAGGADGIGAEHAAAATAVTIPGLDYREVPLVAPGAAPGLHPALGDLRAGRLR